MRACAGPARGRRIAVIALAMALAAGCSSEIQVHGNLPEPEVIAQIQPGSYGRNEVVDLLGTPSSVSTFDDEQWYYIGQRAERFAFFKPEIVARNVLVVSFDGNGRVDDTRTYTLEDGRLIDPVGRETPTEGRDITILQQLFGNIGRFPTETFQTGN